MDLAFVSHALILVGVLLAFLAATILNMIFRAFEKKGAWLIGWTAGSFVVGAGVLIDRVALKGESVASGFGRVIVWSAGIAVLLASMRFGWWLRYELLEAQAQAQERERQSEIKSRYRPKQFNE